MEDSRDRLRALTARIEQSPDLAERMPGAEGAIVRAALRGEPVHAIAQERHMSEAAVWRVLGDAARAAAGQPVTPVETGGLGSDTDPGVTGGYGDTGFGSLGNEPPEPVPEEPPGDD